MLRIFFQKSARGFERYAVWMDEHLFFFFEWMDGKSGHQFVSIWRLESLSPFHVSARENRMDSWICSEGLVEEEEEDGNFLFFFFWGEVYLILWRERERESPCLFRLWSPTR